MTFGHRALVPLLKPGGHFVIGLYNRSGRLMTDARRLLFRLTGGRAKSIDPMLRKHGLSEGKRSAWFADQYRHPHESKHTTGEVLRWLDENGLDFVRGIPALRLSDDGLAGEGLFEAQPRGGSLDHFSSEISQIFAPGQKEGGFFVIIGKRTDPGASE